MSGAAARAMPRTLRLGTRASLLALTQSRLVGRALTRATGCAVLLVEILTPGDTSSAPIATLGTSGVFATPLREALLHGEVDFVVHSFKDLPAAPEPGLALAAVPAREDPRDAIVHPGGRHLLDLPPGSRVGTSAPRRMVELRRLGLAVSIVPMRGNVDTRLRKLADGEVDALILAAAGLSRLGRLDVVTELIDPTLILPAPAQGALAVECRADDEQLLGLLACLDDAHARSAVNAERAFLAALDAGCTTPVGAYGRLAGGQLHLEAFAALDDGEAAVRVRGSSAPGDGPELGRALAATVLRARPDWAGTRGGSAVSR